MKFRCFREYDVSENILRGGERGIERVRIDDDGESKWFVSKQIDENLIKLSTYHTTVVAI